MSLEILEQTTNIFVHKTRSFSSSGLPAHMIKTTYAKPHDARGPFVKDEIESICEILQDSFRLGAYL
jgi:hypothetical protein